MIRHHAILSALLITVAFTTANAQEPIRLARTPDISPDGQFVAFSYLGDIWVVPTSGGVARHVTMHEKHDQYPVFSPDGKFLAFSSNRHGSYDVFVVPVQGGRPTRLTFDSADDFVTGWSPDGQYVLFHSNRGNDFPSRSEIYKVPARGGRATAITRHEGRDGAFSPKGDEIAYVRGPGLWYRKGYRGSSNDDIWVCQADGGNPRQLTSFNGQDHSPSWSPDGKFIYYVSEKFGTPANVVRVPVDKDSAKRPEPQQLTFHKNEGVRRARLSGNGQWLVYECGPDLWLLSTKIGTFRKIAIQVHADDKTNPEKIVTFTADATEFALSKDRDESHIAFVVHGEIFLVRNGTGGKARRLTENPAYDHGPDWHPDGKKIVFLSDRSGHEDIYLLESDDPDHAELHLAHQFKVRQLTDSAESEAGVAFSPDGKKISFVRTGQLITMNLDGSGEKILVKDGTVIDYEWSPDSKWICYSRTDASFASELFIIPATGATVADPPRNVTRFATYNSGMTWSRSGKHLAFLSQRRRDSQSAYVLSLQKPAAPGVAGGSDIDWDDIHLRVRQPSTMDIFECAISNDGNQIACRGQGSDLWLAAADGSSVQRVTTGGLRPTQIQWSRQYNSKFYFRDKLGNIRYASTANFGPVSSAIVPFQAKMVVRQDETFAEVFEQSWRALHDNFYDPAFHGADWNKVRAKYRPLVKHCVMKEDLYVLISLMLGELNASHLGISGSIGTPEEITAELGLIFDPTYRGKGLKIAEIVQRGPADKRGLNLKPGDVVLSIDGMELNEKLDTARALNDKSGTAVTLQVAKDPADKSGRRRVDVVPTTRGVIAELMYDRWTKKNAQRVTELSKGRLGYIHIPSMDQAGLDRFLRALYSDNFDKDAIVLDVRFNGGGFTHDQLLNYLGGKEHTYFFQRNGSFGAVLNFNDRKWSKPLVVLINNRSYSDAEIFPHAFRTLGLGKLIGQATGGYVIGTRNMLLIDGSTFRTPRTGVVTLKGVNMEKEGVMPDFAVDVHPNDLARGLDPQLDKAVEVLQQDVALWRKSQPPTKVEAGIGPSAVIPGPAP